MGHPRFLCTLRSNLSEGQPCAEGDIQEWKQYLCEEERSIGKLVEELRDKMATSLWKTYVESVKNVTQIHQIVELNDFEYEVISVRLLKFFQIHEQMTLSQQINELKRVSYGATESEIEAIVMFAREILLNTLVRKFIEKLEEDMTEDIHNFIFYGEGINFAHFSFFSYLKHDHNPYRLSREGDSNHLLRRNYSSIRDSYNTTGVVSYLYEELQLRVREVLAINQDLRSSEDNLIDQIGHIVLSHLNSDQLQAALTDLLGCDETVFPLIEWLCCRPREDLNVLFFKPQYGDKNTFRLSDIDRKQKNQVDRAESAEKSNLKEVFNKDSTHLPYVFKSTTNFVLNDFGQNFRLPLGTTRILQENFEEYHVPAGKTRPFSKNETLIAVKDAFDEVGQKVFENYSHLNRIQSVVFNTAYKTNENLLVCAPTGSGKTDVALLTILREIKQNTVGEFLDKHAFKIVYIAPMKALATEISEKFSRRLSCLGIIARELTGDMQLSKKEIADTQIIVTTPEKWDVVTRKSIGDTELAGKVRALIIDEIHLLHNERGSVLESLVARTLRQVEMTQNMVRIVGLSATLPNFVDIARFLRVNLQLGLFYFDSGFRPIPLSQTFIGVKPVQATKQAAEINILCFQKVLECVKAGHQAMVFVHSRKETVRTAMAFKDMMRQQSCQELFKCTTTTVGHRLFSQKFDKSKNKELALLFQSGFLFHHAGMLRSDRSLVEQCFSQSNAKVLICTATLAWGVNLPAHTVIIKGTKVYDTQRGGFTDLGVLDVLQIFGRAGRPQYENNGEGIIITTHDKLRYYLSLLLQQIPIESQFLTRLEDHLNAETALGTISNVEEAVTWLSYTYWYVCAQRNPIQHGLTFKDLESDPLLLVHRRHLIVTAAGRLDKAGMIRFDGLNGSFFITDLGRLASHYYINYETVMNFRSLFSASMTEADLIALISSATEFDNLKVREEEMIELERLRNDFCMCNVDSLLTEVPGKVNVLLQTYLSNGKIDDFALTSDLVYVSQNAIRIARFLFEVAIKNGWGLVASRLLALSKSLDRELWSFENPLYQFSILPQEIIEKLEKEKISLQVIYDTSPDKIGTWVQNSRYGHLIKKCALEIPHLNINVSTQPITGSVLRISVQIASKFYWNDKYHGAAEAWWVWIEDPISGTIYNNDYFVMRKKDSKNRQNFTWIVPISENSPQQFCVKTISDRWVGAEDMCFFSFQNLTLPVQSISFTSLLALRPLPITSLQEISLLNYYERGFEYFNPIQTQVFFHLYHTDDSILLGAPTGSGKTVAAELAIWRAFRKAPNKKVVYIAPLKALVRERMEDWREKFKVHLNKIVVELTGDMNPSFGDLKHSDLIVATPEKWDCISRRFYLSDSLSKKVSLIIFDEIHLLGQERGPVLEAIVSRTNFLNKQTENCVRMIGLSTALANPKDLADWLGVSSSGLFNFRPSVRPVPIEIHIQGFAGKHYCPRMASMNKSIFSAINHYSSNQSTLIFVSSRRQTRLTAQDLITCCVMNDNPKQFLKMSENECDPFLFSLKDSSVKLALEFGIGMHHAGLDENDRRIIEHLFLHRKIQVLIATSTLAWGVNLPAHLVIIKGTEFYDGKHKNYVDMSIADVLQMIGRAGRPQFDETGVACVFVQDIKKNFYKKFIYDPFPVESNLETVLVEHINAEIVSGIIRSRQDAMVYMTWTYYFRRLNANPSYYGLKSSSSRDISQHLSNLIDSILQELLDYGCISENSAVLEPDTLGIIAASYYVSVETVHRFNTKLANDHEPSQLLQILSEAHEFSELPIRHNEDLMNLEFARRLPLSCSGSMNSPHVKTLLLLQAHLCQFEMPIFDYVSDLRSLLDQVIRIVQAMIDIAADRGYLTTTLNSIHLMQMIKQGKWLSQSSLLQLPYLNEETVISLYHQYQLRDLCDLIYCPEEKLSTIFNEYFCKSHVEIIMKTIQELPRINVSLNRIISTLSITISSENYESPKSAYTLNFPTTQHESWYLIVGHVEADELLYLKRVTHQQTLTFNCTGMEDDLAVFLLSDNYIGLDQQYNS